MAKRNIKENSFEGAPGGGSGTLNYQTGYGTPSGGNVTQNPSHFASSDKTTSNFVPNTTSGSAVPKMPNRPDRMGSNITTAGGTGKMNTLANDQTPSPAANADQQAANKPLDPDKEFDPQVDQLFNKQQTPSPDEIMSALQYELSQMVKKDKTIAKQIVLKNMRGDPHYYSNLDMLNIDDDKMKVDEAVVKEQTKLVDQSTFEKTKALLDSMVADRQKKIAVANTPEINKIFKDLTDRRFSRGSS
jgi:hypothetical protein